MKNHLERFCYFNKNDEEKVAVGRVRKARERLKERSSCACAGVVLLGGRLSAEEKTED